MQRHSRATEAVKGMSGWFCPDSWHEGRRNGKARWGNVYVSNLGLSGLSFKQCIYRF